MKNIILLALIALVMPQIVLASPEIVRAIAACEWGEVARLLVDPDTKIDILYKDESGRSAVDHANLKGQRDLARYLEGLPYAISQKLLGDPIETPITESRPQESRSDEISSTSVFSSVLPLSSPLVRDYSIQIPPISDLSIERRVELQRSILQELVNSQSTSCGKLPTLSERQVNS